MNKTLIDQVRKDCGPGQLCTVITNGEFINGIHRSDGEIKENEIMHGSAPYSNSIYHGVIKRETKSFFIVRYKNESREIMQLGFKKNLLKNYLCLI